MASIKDQHISVGKETTYGTFVAPTRSYEGKADSFKREQEYIDSMGFRAGMQTLRSDRRPVVNLGGAGSLELDFFNKGMGLILQGAFGSTSGPTQVASTSAYDATFESAADGSDDSFSIQVVRVDSGGTKRVFSHTGCMVTSFGLSHEVGGLLTASFDFDFQNVVTTQSEGTATYVASQDPFTWDMCEVDVDGTCVQATSFDFTGALAMKTDRRYLCASALKSKPVRNGTPEYSGTINADLMDLDLYNDFVNGTIVPITVTWTQAADSIESGYEYTATLTLAACQIEGESPEASLDELTKISVPFRVLHNGSDPAVSLVVRSTDTSL